MEQDLDLKLQMTNYKKYNISVNFSVAIICLVSILPLMWLTYKIVKITGTKEKTIIVMLITIQSAMIFMAIFSSFNIYVLK